jgi:hypothetical protein
VEQKKYLFLYILLGAVALIILSIYFLTNKQTVLAPENEMLPESVTTVGPSVSPIPTECTSPAGKSMTITEAYILASKYCLTGSFSTEVSCNDITGTWWINFNPDTPKQGCSPACVVDINQKTAEINWRCTGLR